MIYELIEFIDKYFLLNLQKRGHTVVHKVPLLIRSIKTTRIVLNRSPHQPTAAIIETSPAIVATASQTTRRCHVVVKTTITSHMTMGRYSVTKTVLSHRERTKILPKSSVQRKTITFISCQI